MVQGVSIRGAGLWYLYFACVSPSLFSLVDSVLLLGRSEQGGGLVCVGGPFACEMNAVVGASAFLWDRMGGIGGGGEEVESRLISACWHRVVKGGWGGGCKVPLCSGFSQPN